MLWLTMAKTFIASKSWLRRLAGTLAASRKNLNGDEEFGAKREFRKVSISSSADWKERIV
jgi:hypothetical protein